MLQEVNKYILNPVYIEDPKNLSALGLAGFMIRFMLIIIPAGMIPGILNSLEIIPDNDLGNYHISSFQAYLLLALILPIIEETLTRLNLKVSLNNLMIFFALIFGILLYRKFIFNNQINFLIALIPLIFITVLILIRLYSHQKVEQKLQYFWIKHFALIFHSSCLIFGFLHILNFEEITINLVLLSPLVVLPQVILGYALGFLRMNYGFHYNVIFHILWNSLFTLFYIN